MYTPTLDVQVRREALWAAQNYSILTEHAQASVGGTTLDDPRVYGFNVTGSYMFNGKVRAYDRRAGYARRMPLTHPWGNFEPGAGTHISMSRTPAWTAAC